jgi:hypothetical protein
MSQSTDSEKQNIAQEMMSILDDSKEKMPDGLYLELCNHLTLLKKEEDLEQKFVKVTFFYTNHTRRDGDEAYHIVIQEQTCIQRYKKPDPTILYSRFDCYLDGISEMFRDTLLRPIDRFYDCNVVTYDPTFKIMSVENM